MHHYVAGVVELGIVHVLSILNPVFTADEVVVVALHHMADIVQLVNDGELVVVGRDGVMFSLKPSYLGWTILLL